MRRSGLVSACLVVAVGLGATACSSSKDTGGSRHDQLCTLVEVIPATSDGELRTTLVDMLTQTSADARSDLFALTLAYRTHQSEYDELAEFEDALSAAVRRAEALESQDSSSGAEAEPTPDETANARAFDRELTENPCPQD